MSQNRKSSDGVDDGILLGTTWPGGTLQQPRPYPLPPPSPPPHLIIFRTAEDTQ